MILCDIGNTHYHFYDNGKIIDSKECIFKNEKIYFISVNDNKTQELLKKNPKSVNLAKYVKFSTSYIGLGIDRIMACKSIKDGIIIDAGSAITIDIMSNGLHLGGYILPGIKAINDSYANISERLDINFNFNIETSILPINTLEAISYGGIGMIISFIQKVAKNQKIYFTGGDGSYLAKFFDNSIYVKDLVFRGMRKTIEEI